LITVGGFSGPGIFSLLALNGGYFTKEFDFDNISLEKTRIICRLIKQFALKMLEKVLRTRGRGWGRRYKRISKETIFVTMGSERKKKSVDLMGD
jgi:hypothetical protein